MLAENTLLSRRKFLAVLPFLPVMAVRQLLAQNSNVPKFAIGDIVEFRYIDEGRDRYERGIVTGIIAGFLVRPNASEWDYQFQIQSASSSHAIGAVAEASESDLILVQKAV